MKVGDKVYVKGEVLPDDNESEIYSIKTMIGGMVRYFTEDGRFLSEHAPIIRFDGPEFTFFGIVDEIKQSGYIMVRNQDTVLIFNADQVKPIEEGAKLKVYCTKSDYKHKDYPILADFGKCRFPFTADGRAFTNTSSILFDDHIKVSFNEGLLRAGTVTYGGLIGGSVIEFDLN